MRSDRTASTRRRTTRWRGSGGDSDPSSFCEPSDVSLRPLRSTASKYEDHPSLLFPTDYSRSSLHRDMRQSTSSTRWVVTVSRLAWKHGVDAQPPNSHEFADHK